MELGGRELSPPQREALEREISRYRIFINHEGERPARDPQTLLRARLVLGLGVSLVCGCGLVLPWQGRSTPPLAALVCLLAVLAIGFLAYALDSYLALRRGGRYLVIPTWLGPLIVLVLLGGFLGYLALR